MDSLIIVGFKQHEMPDTSLNLGWALGSG